jgi:hypothetical protein
MAQHGPSQNKIDDEGDVRHPNPSVNFAEMYGGVDALIQIQDHSTDQDDIMAEYNEPAREQILSKIKDERPVDFAGETYNEEYDD